MSRSSRYARPPHAALEKRRSGGSLKRYQSALETTASHKVRVSSEVCREVSQLIGVGNDDGPTAPRCASNGEDICPTSSCPAGRACRITIVRVETKSRGNIVADGTQTPTTLTIGTKERPKCHPPRGHHRHENPELSAMPAEVEKCQRR